MIDHTTVLKHFIYLNCMDSITMCLRYGNLVSGAVCVISVQGSEVGTTEKLASGARQTPFWLFPGAFLWSRAGNGSEDITG